MFDKEFKLHRYNKKLPFHTMRKTEMVLRKYTMLVPVAQTRCSKMRYLSSLIFDKRLKYHKCICSINLNSRKMYQPETWCLHYIMASGPKVCISEGMPFVATMFRCLSVHREFPCRDPDIITHTNCRRPSDIAVIRHPILFFRHWTTFERFLFNIYLEIMTDTKS